VHTGARGVNVPNPLRFMTDRIACRRRRRLIDAVARGETAVAEDEVQRNGAPAIAQLEQERPTVDGQLELLTKWAAVELRESGE
jgi:hypothetical protein